MEKKLNILIINNNYEEELVNTGKLMGYHRISRFQDILNKYELVKNIETINFLEFEGIFKRESDFFEKFDAIILSGSTLNVSEFKKAGSITHFVTNDGKIFKFIIEELIKSKKPILAVCFGMQLLANYYDEKSIFRPSYELPNAVKETYRIKMIKIQTESLTKDPLFQGFDTLTVDLNHSDYILPTKYLQKEMRIIEIQKHENFECIHYFRHNNGIYFGIQFHPECKTIKKYNSEPYIIANGTDFTQCQLDGKKLLENFVLFVSKI